MLNCSLFHVIQCFIQYMWIMARHVWNFWKIYRVICRKLALVNLLPEKAQILVVLSTVIYRIKLSCSQRIKGSSKAIYSHQVRLPKIPTLEITQATLLHSLLHALRWRDLYWCNISNEIQQLFKNLNLWTIARVVTPIGPCLSEIHALSLNSPTICDLPLPPRRSSCRCALPVVLCRLEYTEYSTSWDYLLVLPRTAENLF